LFDATGFGAAQLTTIAVCNPWLPRSAQHLRVFGLGNCGDDRDGMVRLMGPNLAFINEIFHAKRAGRLVSIALGNYRVVELDIELKVVLDVAALRHCEHMLNAGWCCCPREQGLRTIPKKQEAGDGGRDDQAFAHLREPDFREALPYVAQPSPREASA
jgi:hypothetical protein